MPLKNSKTEYGTVTKIFHWVTALIVICMLAAGLLMADLKPLTLKLTVYNLHKSFGITVLALILCRICWHIFSNRPAPVTTLKPWKKILSALMHYSLYILLLAMPLTGWLMSSAAGRPVHVFGLFILPDLVSPDQIAAKVYRQRHGQISELIMIFGGLHIAAALKHHFIDKDIVLKRMLPMLLSFLIIFPVSASAATKTWYYLHGTGSISFNGKQMGQAFSGEFERFAPQINFDPNHLSDSKVIISIDTTSLNTHAADRDDAAKGPEWFDTAKFPAATFETKRFRKIDDKTYEVDAHLTIRDITIPVTLPFTLNIVRNDSDKEDRATVDAAITLDRSKFKLGTGSWADTSVIANDIFVKIHLTAIHSDAQR